MPAYSVESSCLTLVVELFSKRRRLGMVVGEIICSQLCSYPCACAHAASGFWLNELFDRYSVGLRAPGPIPYW